MYIMSEPDGNWKPEAFSTLLNLFNNTNRVLVNPRKKVEDGYIGLIYSDKQDCRIDVSRQLKAEGVVNDFNM